MMYTLKQRTKLTNPLTINLSSHVISLYKTRISQHPFAQIHSIPSPLNNLITETSHILHSNMDSKKSDEVAISRDAKGKAVEGAPPPPPPPVVVTTKATKIRNIRGKKGLAIIDIVLRLGAGSAALAAAYISGNTEQILPFFTQFFQFHAQYNDLPTFTYANF